MPKSHLYFPELDSLRFLAFLAVFIHHAPFAGFIEGWETLHRYGWIGVDVFLCLSAFLFAKILFAEHTQKGGINVRYFYLRRLLRIWPLYFAFLAAMLTYQLIAFGWNGGISPRLLGSLTFTDNIFSAFLGYNAAIPYFAHLWTISYEEQVYLFIPWILAFFYRREKRVALLYIGIAALIGSCLRAALVYAEADYLTVWTLPITHFESVLGGLVVGLGLFDKPLQKIPAWIQLAGGLVMLYFVTTLPNVTRLGWESMLTYPLVGAGVSLVLSAVSTRRLGLVSNMMESKSLGYLGKISYGLYVYHILALEAVKKLTEIYIPPERELLFPIAVLAAGLVVTVATSALSYEALEKPFQRMKARFTLIENRAT